MQSMFVSQRKCVYVKYYKNHHPVTAKWTAEKIQLRTSPHPKFPTVVRVYDNVSKTIEGEIQRGRK